MQALICRGYPDGFVVGFQTEADAKRLRTAMEERLNQFALEVAPEKTQCNGKQFRVKSWNR